MERLYQQLKTLNDVPHLTQESVHLTPMPIYNENLIQSQVEKTVTSMQTVLTLIRSARDKKNLSSKLPLKEAIVFCSNSRYFFQSNPYLFEIQGFETYYIFRAWSLVHFYEKMFY